MTYTADGGRITTDDVITVMARVYTTGNDAGDYVTVSEPAITGSSVDGGDTDWWRKSAPAVGPVFSLFQTATGGGGSVIGGVIVKG